MIFFVEEVEADDNESVSGAWMKQNKKNIVALRTLFFPLSQRARTVAFEIGELLRRQPRFFDGRSSLGTRNRRHFDSIDFVRCRRASDREREKKRRQRGKKREKNPHSFFFVACSCAKWRARARGAGNSCFLPSYGSRREQRRHVWCVHSVSSSERGKGDETGGAKMATAAAKLKKSMPPTTSATTTLLSSTTMTAESKGNFFTHLNRSSSS